MLFKSNYQVLIFQFIIFIFNLAQQVATTIMQYVHWKDLFEFKGEIFHVITFTTINLDMPTSKSE